MGLTLQEQLVALFVSFLTLNTIAVGLRLYVRLRLQSSAFGWDDVFLTITYIGLSLHVAFSLVSMHYGVIAFDAQPWYSPAQAKLYSAVTCDICFIISGTVKISVALVIYRLLEYRPVLKAIVIADIVICCIWTVVYTLILSLGCTGTHISPYKIDDVTCQNVMYAQEATYIIFSVFQVVFPVALMWNTQIRRRHKWAVITLFSLGGLSTIAVIFKLLVVIELYHPGPTTDYRELWARGNKWATVEHGMSLFAASVLAVGPIFAPVVQGWTSFSASISRRYSLRRDSRLFSIFRRRKDRQRDEIWGWASRRNSDRELVTSAAMPTVRGDSALDVSSSLHLSSAPSYSPGKSKPFDWEQWSKFADNNRPPLCERSTSYRNPVAPDVRPGTSNSFKGQEATDVSYSI